MSQVIAKSDLGVTLQNDSNAVMCVNDMQTLPSGASGTALKCTHLTQMPGSFFHGITADLQVDVKYTFSFFFRNGSFDSPYGQFPPAVGVKMISPNGGGGGQLVMFDAYPNGWYRQRYMFTATATGTHRFGFMHSLDRPAGGEYWLYGFQVQTEFGVTEYIPE